MQAEVWEPLHQSRNTQENIIGACLGIQTWSDKSHT